MEEKLWAGVGGWTPEVGGPEPLVLPTNADMSYVFPQNNSAHIKLRLDNWVIAMAAEALAVSRPAAAMV